MADFAALGAADHAGFTDAVRGEVVLQHEVVLAGAFQGVDELGIAHATQGSGDDRLGFAAGEQRGAVGFLEHAHLAFDRAHRVQGTAVDTRLAGDHRLAHHVLFHLAEQVLHFTGFRRAFFFGGELGHTGVAQLADFLLAGHFVGDGVGVRQSGFVLALDGVLQLGVLFSRLPLPGGGAHFGGELVDRLDQPLHFLVAEQHRAQHLVFAELLGFGFHHQHGGFGTGDHQVEGGLFQLGIGRVEQVQAVLEAHACRADGAAERNARDRQGGGGADHGGDIRILVLVRGHDRGHDLDFVHEALGKQRANRPVDQTAGQGFFLAGTTFTLEEAAGNAAGGVGLFLVVHGEREERLVGVGFFFADHGDQHLGVTDGDHHGGGGLAGDLPGFQDNGVAAVLNLFTHYIEHIASRLSSRLSSLRFFIACRGIITLPPKQQKPGTGPSFRFNHRSHRGLLSGAGPDVRSTSDSGRGSCRPGSPAAYGAG